MTSDLQKNSTRTRLLVVEDDPDHADLLTRALSGGKRFDEVYVCCDGEDALDRLFCRNRYADAERPDLVLLDLKIPRIGGHDVLKAIRSDASFDSLPVIVLTTSDADDDRKRAYKERANSFVIKPFSPDEFSTFAEVLTDYWVKWNKS